MTKEQIKENIKLRLLDNHKAILEDICMSVHNCADCFDWIQKKLYCKPCIELETFHVSKNTFCIEAYYDSKFNRTLIDIARKHGYEAGIMFENGICMIKYWKH